MFRNFFNSVVKLEIFKIQYFEKVRGNDFFLRKISLRRFEINC